MFGYFDDLGVYDLRIIELAPQKKRKPSKAQRKMRLRKKNDVSCRPMFYPRRSNHNS